MCNDIEYRKIKERVPTELFQISNILNGKFDVDKSKFIVSQDDIDFSRKIIIFCW